MIDHFVGFTQFTSKGAKIREARLAKLTIGLSQLVGDALVPNLECCISNKKRKKL